MKTALIILVVFISVQSSAQDTHYWTYRFGTRAVLMGGPAVGGGPAEEGTATGVAPKEALVGTGPLPAVEVRDSESSRPCN